MGVGSQKGKGSEMAFDTEFSARWKSRIMILFVNCNHDRKIAYTKSKREWSKMSHRNLGKGILDGVKETKSIHKGQKELEMHISPDGHFKIPHLWPPQNTPPVKVAV